MVALSLDQTQMKSQARHVEPKRSLYSPGRMFNDPMGMQVLVLIDNDWQQPQLEMVTSAEISTIT